MLWKLFPDNQYLKYLWNAVFLKTLWKITEYKDSLVCLEIRIYWINQ